MKLKKDNLNRQNEYYECEHYSKGFKYFSLTHFAPDGRIGKPTPHAQNSTFASPMKKSGCKRAVFFALAPVRFCYF
jgi:hypothetical protein